MNDVVTVLVATEFLAELNQWSEPVQAKIVKTNYGTGWELIFRKSWGEIKFDE